MRKHLLDSLAPALEQIAKEVVSGQAHDGGRVTGLLRLTTFRTPYGRVLEPRLPAFLLRHPAVRVRCRWASD